MLSISDNAREFDPGLRGETQIKQLPKPYHSTSLLLDAWRRLVDVDKATVAPESLGCSRSTRPKRTCNIYQQ